MKNIIAKIPELKDLAENGLVCLADDSSGSVNYIVVTSNEELIHYFCKNSTIRSIHVPDEIEVESHEIKLFDVISRQYIAVNFHAFHGYVFSVASATNPNSNLDLPVSVKIDFENAVTNCGAKVVLINEIQNTEFCNVIAYNTNGNPSVTNVNEYGINPDGERVALPVSNLNLVDVVLVLSKDAAPSFIPIEKEMLGSMKAKRTLTSVVMFASILMSSDKGGKEEALSIHILKDKPVL